jgi:hypothetical protein
MFVGVDACKGGWVEVVASAAESATRVCREILLTLVSDMASAEAIVLDMPIGAIEDHFRPLDQLARNFVGDRGAASSQRRRVRSSRVQVTLKPPRCASGSPGRASANRHSTLAPRIREPRPWRRSANACIKAIPR